jgi:rubrerythrin
MQDVQVFRCTICGDPYIGFEKPTNCPFCGAHEQYIVPSDEWKDTNKVELSEESRKNLRASLDLEIGNAEFYLCVSKGTKNEEKRAMFKALSKVESEHASTICKILRIDKPAIELREEICESMNEEEIIEEADRRENRAVRRYTEFLAQASEPRVKELFTALIEIESDHIDLVSGASGMLNLKKENRDNPPEESELKDLDRNETDYFDSYDVHGD